MGKKDKQSSHSGIYIKALWQDLRTYMLDNHRGSLNFSTIDKKSFGFTQNNLTSNDKMKLISIVQHDNQFEVTDCVGGKIIHCLSFEDN